MTPTLVQRHLPHAASVPRADLCARARDWAEIQERMLVPLYEAVYERLEVGPGTRLLGLGCGSGLALLMAASRGAAVTGVEAVEPERLALARERLLPDALEGQRPRARTASVRLTDGSDDAVVAGPDATPYDIITAFQPIGCTAGDAEGLSSLLESAAPLAERGAAVVLVGWGPPERCTTSSVLRVATKLADPLRSAGSWRPALRDDLEEVAHRAGLRPDGSGRVACPFGYADTESAVKGLLSTGLFDAAVGATDPTQVDKEVTEALQPYLRQDGTVWMPNVFRYLIARTV
ncbi:SAM-dependent methyltransferase [Streptomyces sp. VRA16 Mangrove soil]|uniref:SAM-dependent methyltransferase n=1 Tax=Streptomyces sp. VRA16 Mangrove soil TaxID=2817434 RepID=UPI001A9D0730|nr:SAM-dependent methyltransferase [Streptomyces sp. VRA16 Mangrove soil]MBO1335930.1 SAM-dependent methyltransferase [Streptomyces sp. VRA16 Mangrove soil]